MTDANVTHSEGLTTNPAPITLKPVPCHRCKSTQFWAEEDGRWNCVKCLEPFTERQVRRKIELRPASGVIGEGKARQMEWVESDFQPLPLLDPLELGKEALESDSATDFVRTLPTDATPLEVLEWIYAARKASGEVFAAAVIIEIHSQMARRRISFTLLDLLPHAKVDRMGCRAARTILLFTRGEKDTVWRRSFAVRLFERVSLSSHDEEAAIRRVLPLM